MEQSKERKKELQQAKRWGGIEIAFWPWSLDHRPGLLPAPGSSCCVAPRPLRAAGSEFSRLLRRRSESSALSAAARRRGGRRFFFKREKQKKRERGSNGSQLQRRRLQRTTTLPPLFSLFGAFSTRWLSFPPLLAVDAGVPAPCDENLNLTKARSLNPSL